jgi:transposase, IS30 family
MELGKCTKQSRKGKHLNKEERVVVERMSRVGYPARDIAEALDRHRRTIEREIVRGSVEHKDSEWRVKMVYSSDRGQDLHDLNATAKGSQLKLGSNRDLVLFVRTRIIDQKEAPAVVAFRMREANMAGAICTKTIYNYIEQGLIEGVSNESLWEKRKRHKRQRHTLRRSRKAPTRRQSIEKRPKQVEQRDEFGHWEIDLVVGPSGSKAALMTLVERKTRNLIVRKVPDKTHAAVRRALNVIERNCGADAFRSQFKSITADNGSEFLDVDGLQMSVLSDHLRTSVFYAHPYASWERGTNENTNRIIRRFIDKGRKIETLSIGTIRTIEEWINNYPRNILNFRSPHQCFKSELKEIAA